MRSCLKAQIRDELWVVTALWLEAGHGLGSGGHVSAFGHGEAAIGHQSLGTLQIQLVLGGAGQSDVTGDGPDALAALHVLGGGNVVQIGLDALALDFLDLLDDLVINAVGIVDVAGVYKTLYCYGVLPAGCRHCSLLHE